MSRGGCAGGVLVVVVVGRGSQAQAEAHACAERERERRRFLVQSRRKRCGSRLAWKGLRLVCCRVQVPAVACSVCVCGCGVWREE